MFVAAAAPAEAEVTAAWAAACAGSVVTASGSAGAAWATGACAGCTLIP